MNKGLIKHYLLLILSFILIGIYVYFLSNYSFSIYSWTTIIIQLSIFCILIFRIALVYLKYFVNYMFNTENHWFDKKFQRPRLLVYLIFVPTAYFTMDYMHNENKILKENIDFWFYFLNVLYLHLFFISVLLLCFTWSNKFKNQFITDIQKRLEKSYKLHFIKSSNFEKICASLISEGKTNTSIDVFESIFINDDSSVKINWTDIVVRNKYVSNHSIFDFLNEIVEGGVYGFKEEKRANLMKFICDNFMKDNKDIIPNSINVSYTNWKPI